jgi:microcystin-dependent protein
MADSFSTLLNLRLQQTGGNDNTWGDLLNSDTITPLENAIAGLSSHAVTGGTLDLSATPLVHQVHKFTGVLTADQTVTIPNLSKVMKVHNATTGAFLLLLKTAAGPAINIPQGTVKDVYCDGSNVLYRLDRSDVGEIKHFGNASVPAGFLECDGSAISRANYPDLFAAIGTTWGAGNGATTFNIPDLKTAGRFLRSRTGSVAVGTYQAADIGPHNHTASASSSGSVTIAGDGGWTPSISTSNPAHSHTVSHGIWGGSTTANVAPPAGGISFPCFADGVVIDATTTAVTASSSGIGNHVHSGSSISVTTGVTVNNSTGTETRPINAVALACIRF